MVPVVPCDMWPCFYLCWIRMSGLGVPSSPLSGVTSTSVCAFVCAHVCACIWNPEDNLRCQYLSTIHPGFEMGSFTDVELSQDPLVFVSLVLGLQVHSCQPLYMGSGHGTQVLMLVRPTPYPLSHLSNLHYILKVTMQLGHWTLMVWPSCVRCIFSLFS